MPTSHFRSTAEKVVFSSTLTDTEWENTRFVDADPVAVVKQLREQEGGDIVVLASSSVIKALLAADEVDRLSITLCPELVGAGARLFDDGTPASSWTLALTGTSGSGALTLYYERIR